MDRVDFCIYGEPVAKGRPRFIRKTGRAYTPSKTTNYESLIKLTYQFVYNEENKIFFEKGIPLMMIIEAYFSIPKSASKKDREKMINKLTRPTKKPDIDNIVKIVGDALNGIAYHDDSQIVVGLVEKYYAEEPYLRVVIKEI